MGALFPIGFDTSEAERKQDRLADERLHKHTMTLLNSIKDGIKNPGNNKTIGDLLRSATPLQRVRVRAHLEEQDGYWEGKGAPIEAGVVKQALQAFDVGEYDNGHIARYLTKKVIEEIFVQ